MKTNVNTTAIIPIIRVDFGTNRVSIKSGVAITKEEINNPAKNSTVTIIQLPGSPPAVNTMNKYEKIKTKTTTFEKLMLLFDNFDLLITPLIYS